jgi:hypothetical protein
MQRVFVVSAGFDKTVKDAVDGFLRSCSFRVFSGKLASCRLHNLETAMPYAASVTFCRVHFIYAMFVCELACRINAFH